MELRASGPFISESKARWPIWHFEAKDGGLKLHSPWRSWRRISRVRIRRPYSFSSLSTCHFQRCPRKSSTCRLIAVYLTSTNPKDLISSRFVSDLFAWIWPLWKIVSLKKEKKKRFTLISYRRRLRGSRTHGIRSSRSITVPFLHGQGVTKRTAALGSQITERSQAHHMYHYPCLFTSRGIFKYRERELKVPRDPRDVDMCRRQDRFAHRARGTLHLGPDIRPEDGRTLTKRRKMPAQTDIATRCADAGTFVPSKGHRSRITSTIIIRDLTLRLFRGLCQNALTI